MTRPWRDLPFDDWPQADQVAWTKLLRDGDILDGRGAGAHWSPATRKMLQRHYAGWLGWLQANNQLDAKALPEDRVTEAAVTSYARELMKHVAPVTTSSKLRDLKVVAKVMAPERNWRWLMDLTNRLKTWAKPSRARPSPDISAPEMFRSALQELERLRQGTFGERRQQLAYRDTLLVAMLICSPVRLKNIAMIRIGDHLQRHGQEWVLSFKGEEMKNRQPLRLVLHDQVVPHLAFFLETVRPLLPGAETGNHLWPANKGQPMAHPSIYDRVRQTTERLFGTALSPHDFRSIAATFLAETSPEDALLARPLLGHRNLATTETYYVTANQLRASKKVNEVLERIRREQAQG